MTHHNACLTILLIQNNPAVAGQIGVALAAGDAGSFEVEWARQLSQGLERMSRKGIAAILLDLSLPDSEGVATFDKLFATSPDVPILILAEAVARRIIWWRPIWIPIRSNARYGMRWNAKALKTRCS